MSHFVVAFMLIQYVSDRFFIFIVYFMRRSRHLSIHDEKRFIFLTHFPMNKCEKEIWRFCVFTRFGRSTGRCLYCVFTHGLGQRENGKKIRQNEDITPEWAWIDEGEWRARAMTARKSANSDVLEHWRP